MSTITQESPLVSIIIPCFNCSETIQAAVMSAKEQVYPSVETIIIDDGSTDGSYDVLINLITGMPNTKLLSQSNSGASTARNQGFLHAKGEFLMFLDGDDILHENYISECMAVYKKQPDLQIVYSNAQFFGAKEGKWRLGPFNMDTILFKNSIPIFPVIRASTFEEVGMFDENLTYAEDWELWLRILARYGPMVHRIEQPLYYYRKNDSKTSLTDMRYINDGWDEAFLYIYRKHYKRYKEYHGSIFDLFDGWRYRRKYFDEWYRKLFYRLIKPKKYRKLYGSQKPSHRN